MKEVFFLLLIQNVILQYIHISSMCRVHPKPQTNKMVFVNVYALRGEHLLVKHSKTAVVVYPSITQP